MSDRWDPNDDIEEDLWRTTKSLFADQEDMQSTTASAYSDHHDLYDSSDEHEDEKEELGTTSSASNALVTTTNIITETTTETTAEYNFFDLHFLTSTMDPQEIAIYIAKASKSPSLPMIDFHSHLDRERLLLKIFTITIAIGMSILSVALFTIHLLQKSKRYRGYRSPADALPPKSSV